MVSSSNSSSSPTSTFAAPSSLSPTLISADATDVDLNTNGGIWNWKKYRTRKPFKGGYRDYFACSNVGCSAKKLVDYATHDGLEPKNIAFSGEHNHLPPSVPRADPAIRQRSREKLAAHVPPAEVGRQLVQEALARGETPNPSNVLSMTQLHNQKAYLRASQLPSREAISNIIARHRDTFLLRIENYPATRIILSTPEQRRFLTTNGNYAFVDGTFNVCSQPDIVLTTLMVATEDNWGIPVAWMLCDSGRAEDYATFIRAIQAATLEVSPHGFNPVAFVTDFDLALQKGLNLVVPTASLHGDYFHFMQANIRRRQQGRQRNEADKALATLVPMLRILWNSPDALQFRQNLDSFLRYWSVTDTDYANYFYHQWCEVQMPHSWAAFGRLKSAPSGDQMLEGWHNRLQKTLASNSLRIDILINRLREEWDWYHATISNRGLRMKHLQNLQDRQQQTQRKRDRLEQLPFLLTDWFADRMAPPLQLNDIQAGEKRQCVEEENTPMAENGTTPNLTQTELVLSSNKDADDDGVCGACHRGKVNKRCGAALCQTCCAKDVLKRCCVTSHQRAKMQHAPPAWLTQLDTAIKAKQRITLVYRARQKSEAPREVELRGWINYPTMFTALCLASQIEKTYRTDRVTTFHTLPVTLLGK